MDYKYLGGIERGERNPSTENLAKIAKALGVKVHELFIFEHEIENLRLLKKGIDELLKEAFPSAVSFPGLKSPPLFFLARERSIKATNLGLLLKEMVSIRESPLFQF